MSRPQFQRKVTEVCYNIIKRQENVTVRKILNILDKQENYDKDEYLNKYSQIYNTLLRQQNNIWEEWNNYQDTPEYKNAYSIRKRIPNEKLWETEAFKEIYDMGIFTEEQLEGLKVEASVFQDFLHKTRNEDRIFLIAGRGINTYRIPLLPDFFFYKFKNLQSEKLRFKNQLQKYTKDGLMLPSGITVKQLERLEDHVLETLEYQKEASS